MTHEYWMGIGVVVVSFVLGSCGGFLTLCACGKFESPTERGHREGKALAEYTRAFDAEVKGVRRD